MSTPLRHAPWVLVGIAVSERTVSRYLQGRPMARSQTWRTFFANHLGDLAFMAPVNVVVAAPGDDVVVDASGLSLQPVPLSLDGLCAANQWAIVDWAGFASTYPSWLASRPRSCLRPNGRAKPHRP